MAKMPSFKHGLPEMQQRASDLGTRLRAMATRAGHSIFFTMNKGDDELEALFTHHIEAGWLRVKKQTFDDGPQIILFPKLVEENWLKRQAFDPSTFDEKIVELNDDGFHVQNMSNSTSPNLFNDQTDHNEETMEVIEIIAVSGADSD